MVTLYDRDAKAVSTLLALAVRYHEAVTRQDIEAGGGSSGPLLVEMGNWGLRSVDAKQGSQRELATFGVGIRQMVEVATIPGDHRAVADYLSSLCFEIDAQLKLVSEA